jgi:hypothetical protein
MFRLISLSDIFSINGLIVILENICSRDVMMIYTAKNYNVGFEFLDDHYQYYHSSSYDSLDTSDNVCLDRYLIYTFYVYDNNNSLSDHQSSPDVKCPFSSCLCIFCSSTIYGFWLPLWYVLAIANTMVLMSSVNKVGIMHRGWASINRSVETGLSVVFWAFLNQIFCPVNFAKIAYSSSATNNSFVYKQNQIWNTMRASMKLLTKWL